MAMSFMRMFKAGPEVSYGQTRKGKKREGEGGWGNGESIGEGNDRGEYEYVGVKNNQRKGKEREGKGSYEKVVIREKS